ncbi:MAG: Maf-like protein [Thermoguttaceae bacterium]|nr:Maf-like protein [Thermoguttaceae bacterium]
MGLEYLILASQSPRRQALLAESGRLFSVIPAEGVDEESPRLCSDPKGLAVRNALAKARFVAGQLRRENGPHLVIGCDTIACVPAGGGEAQYEILGKPDGRADARRMLSLLSGSDHLVISGLALIEVPSGREVTASETTELYMEPLADPVIEDYLESGKWQGKAGAFGYQDGIAWLHKKSGSTSNIVGLPMELLDRLLDEFGTKETR